MFKDMEKFEGVRESDFIEYENSTFRCEMLKLQRVRGSWGIEWTIQKTPIQEGWNKIKQHFYSEKTR